ncbi:MAG: hypothetical protein ACFFG0_08435 [Candidatus Thorarchaeota archaeon]
MESTRSEDCLIFYAFSPNITKYRQVSSLIADFMQKKKSIDPSDRFNFIWFQDEGPNYLDHFTFDPEYALNTLKPLSINITRANIAGGIFIAITFIIEVFKKISQKFFRLLILVDDGAYEIPDDYITALEGIINKVKDMPFFIDIVLLGSPYSDQAQKLLRIANLSNGELFCIKNLRELNQVLKNLSEKKFILQPWYLKSKTREILPENQPFYVNLADIPKPIEGIVSCSICFHKDDHGIVKCPSCDTFAHEICWAQWAETTNIGIPHVFRCHNCFNILKLDKQFVDDVQTGKIPSIEELIKMQKKDIVEYLHEIESRSKPKIIHTEDPMKIEVPATAKGSEIDIQARKSREKARRISINICPNCSKFIVGNKKNCPSCGYALF